MGCTHVLVFGSIVLVFGIIMAGCFIGATVNSNNNQRLVPASCKTESTAIVTTSCTNACCTFDANNQCMSCTYTCYDGYVTASIPNITTSTSFRACNYDFSSSVNAYLNVNFPVGRTFGCFYTFDGSVVSIRLSYYPVQTVWIAGYVMGGIAATALLVWIVWELVVWLPQIDWCRPCNHIKAQRAAVKLQIATAQAREKREQEILEAAASAMAPPVSVPAVVPSAPEIDEK